ncbi:hypothetical protein SNEBB_005775 [Seison nebaliae]|nr:hypothetical protein SNEBB_005775 [Seison nebaliae]
MLFLFFIHLSSIIECKRCNDLPFCAKVPRSTCRLMRLRVLCPITCKESKTRLIENAFCDLTTECSEEKQCRAITKKFCVLRRINHICPILCESFLTNHNNKLLMYYFLVILLLFVNSSYETLSQCVDNPFCEKISIIQCQFHKIVKECPLKCKNLECISDKFFKRNLCVDDNSICPTLPYEHCRLDHVKTICPVKCRSMACVEVQCTDIPDCNNSSFFENCTNSFIMNMCPMKCNAIYCNKKDICNEDQSVCKTISTSYCSQLHIKQICPNLCNSEECISRSSEEGECKDKDTICSKATTKQYCHLDQIQEVCPKTCNNCLKIKKCVDEMFCNTIDPGYCRLNKIVESCPLTCQQCNKDTQSCVDHKICSKIGTQYCAQKKIREMCKKKCKIAPCDCFDESVCDNVPFSACRLRHVKELCPKLCEECTISTCRDQKFCTRSQFNQHHCSERISNLCPKTCNLLKCLSERQKFCREQIPQEYCRLKHIEELCPETCHSTSVSPTVTLEVATTIIWALIFYYIIRYFLWSTVVCNDSGMAGQISNLLIVKWTTSKE